MAKIYLQIKKGCDEYENISKWLENKKHQDQMFNVFIKDMGSCEERTLTDKYIYMTNPKIELVIKSYPHVREVGDKQYRFNRHSALFKDWLEFKEDNYLDELGDIDTLRDTLQLAAEKITYYENDKECLLDITPHEHNYMIDEYKANLQDRIYGTKVVLLNGQTFMQKVLKGGYYKHQYTKE